MIGELAGTPAEEEGRHRRQAVSRQRSTTRSSAHVRQTLRGLRHRRRQCASVRIGDVEPEIGT